MFRLEDLVAAYRKAKVDLFYGTSGRERDILEYEEHLEQNLRGLLRFLADSGVSVEGDLDDVASSSRNPGQAGFDLVPKSLEITADEAPSDIASFDNWGLFAERSQSVPARLDLRLMSRCTIDLHVLSSLWINTVGEQLDRTLSDSAYGNRLRRNRLGSYNESALGSLKPYIFQYRAWQNDAMRRIEQTLDENIPLLVVSADAKAFYHGIQPQFLLSETYTDALQGVGLDLTGPTRGDLIALNRLFVNLLQEWSRSTAGSLRSKGILSSDDPRAEVGLPVGLTASSVIANLALRDLDRMIHNELAPIHYGRYVDDILLVIQRTPDVQSAHDVWEWIRERTDLYETGQADEDKPRLKITRDDGPGTSMRVEFRARYSVQTKAKQGEEEAERAAVSASFILGSKNNVRALEGVSGRAGLASIRKAMTEQSSEWRALPTAPEDLQSISTKMVVAVQKDGTAADSLGRAGGLATQRAQFAFLLRDFEAMDADLPSESWREYRKEFFQAVDELVIAPEQFCDLWKYFPRLLKLALSIEDWTAFARMVRRIYEVVNVLSRVDSTDIAGFADSPTRSGAHSNEAQTRRRHIEALKQSVNRMITNALETVCPEVPEGLEENLFRLNRAPSDIAWMRPVLEGTRTSKIWARLFERDLAYRARRFQDLPYSDQARAVEFTSQTAPLAGLLPRGVRDSLQLLKGALNRKEPDAYLAYPTRPFSAEELCFVCAREPDGRVDMNQLSTILKGLRGYGLETRWPELDPAKKTESLCTRTVVVGDPEGNDAAYDRNRRILGLAVLETDPEDLKRAAMGRPNLSVERYRTFNGLVNQSAAMHPRNDYLVFPELSVPPGWFVRAAKKLSRSNASIIAGIEYQPVSRSNGDHDKNHRFVTNEIWSSLAHGEFGFPTGYVYRQEKQRPAPNEEINLLELGGYTLRSRRQPRHPQIIAHNGFWFAMLICSELTNIEYRSSLRGLIDALVVVEWNQDLKTFNALVESSAQDIHCYVVQSNNRKYGDNRIRVPASAEWDRNAVQHSGGMTDYVVAGKIEFKKLREHQSVNQVPKDRRKFKPVPDGFEISLCRSV